MRRYIYLFLSLSIVFFLIINAAANKENSQPCKGCHKNIYNIAINSPYQHSVARDKCDTCHTSRSVGQKSNSERSKKLINVISHTFKGEGVFSLGQLNQDNKYELEIITTDKNGKESSRKSLEVEPKKMTEEVVSHLKEIVDVKVVELKSGIFLRASISWRTSTAATSEVEYGLTSRYGDRVSANGTFTTEHRAFLTGLKKDQKYYFRAISKDIFGNVVKSKENVLDTSKLFSSKDNTLQNSVGGTAIANAKIYRVKGRGIYSSITLNEYSGVKLSISKKLVKDNNSAHSFPTQKYSTITVCIECHNQGASHPVNVGASRKGLIIPDDIPTIDGGIMTCVSCHNPHGSKNEYLARFKFNRDLCIKCHVSDGLV